METRSPKRKSVQPSKVKPTRRANSEKQPKASPPNGLKDFTAQLEALKQIARLLNLYLAEPSQVEPDL
jgi:hypothetical protein